MSTQDTNLWEVLVVEDTQDIANVVAKILSFHGIRVHLAHDGEECLQMLSSIDPTLIITDLSMPGIDGWTVLEKIRADPSTSHIPVVAVTAYHSKQVQQDAVRLGFDAYFPKPVDAATFVKRLVELFAMPSS